LRKSSRKGPLVGSVVAFSDEPMSIRVTYFYSACVRIDTPDVRVLCDPWFTPGAYDGSWFQFPRLEQPLKRIGEVDLIYISHIHPDHYDATFLRQYLQTYPRARLLIADFKHNHLLRKMRADGFAPEAVAALSFGTTRLDILPNEAAPDSDPNDVDSALVVRRGERSVVNMNDNAFNGSHVHQICSLCPKLDIALLGYTGAGPYPQTYHEDPTLLRDLAGVKKREFFARYRRLREALSPRLAIPFAGKYLLGGKLAELNEFRGVADAVEVLQFDRYAVVLDDGGDASVDAETLVPTRVRTQPYSAQRVAAALQELCERPMAYESYFSEQCVPALPLTNLARKAYATAIARSTCDVDYYFCFPHGGSWIVANANKLRPAFEVRDSVVQLRPRSEVTLDPRYLFGLLTGVFHWNNAEIGSHLRVRREPDAYNRAAQRFLNFFHA
jgi:UDP-MurNAc hydroxylase